MMPAWNQQRLESIISVGFVGAFIAFIFFYATAPIADPDFWWHLKTGEVMTQIRGLLQSDPFAYPGDGVLSIREEIILKGYWLWQLTAYGLYSLLGFNGIFLLNFLTVGAMAGVVALQMRRQQVDCFLVILLMSLGFYLLRSIHTLERPQVISFLMAAILLGFLSVVRDGGRLGWPLPVLMLLWANLHGGFVVGVLILLCFATGAIGEYRHDIPRLRHLFYWIGIAIGASFLNPNGGLAFVELFSFHNSALMTGVSEYQSTWVKFQKGTWSVAILWLLIALLGFGIWRSRRLYWPELGVALFLSVFSVAYLRNVGFFAVATLPAIGFYLQQGKVLNSRFFPPVFKNFIIVITATALLWQVSTARSNNESVISFFPAESSQFVLTSGLQGKMLNSYNFGGYQLWRWYPQHRVFIDGRGLDPDIYRDWKLMVSASLLEKGSRKEFEVLLDSYGIDYVVQPHLFHDTGRLTPLLKFLMVKPEWIPIYIDQQCFVLVRNSQINAAVIDRYRLDKHDFNNKLIGHLTALCNGRPTEVINHVALAEMLIFVSRYDEAEERLSLIFRLQPDNNHLSALRNQLDVLKNRKRS